MPGFAIPPDKAATEREAIRAEAEALARRARRVGMPITAYMLDLAVLETDQQSGLPKKPT